MSDSEENIDDDTAKIVALEERADLYNLLEDEEKIKSFDEYQAINSLVKEYEETITGYKKELSRLEKVKFKQKKVDSKLFSKCVDRFDEIEKTVDSSMSITELLRLYKELRSVKQKMTTYLEGKKMEIIDV